MSALVDHRGRRVEAHRGDLYSPAPSVALAVDDPSTQGSGVRTEGRANVHHCVDSRFRFVPVASSPSHTSVGLCAAGWAVICCDTTGVRSDSSTNVNGAAGVGGVAGVAGVVDPELPDEKAGDPERKSGAVRGTLVMEVGRVCKTWGRVTARPTLCTFAS